MNRALSHHGGDRNRAESEHDQAALSQFVLDKDEEQDHYDPEFLAGEPMFFPKMQFGRKLSLEHRHRSQIVSPVKEEQFLFNNNLMPETLFNSVNIEKYGPNEDQ